MCVFFRLCNKVIERHLALSLIHMYRMPDPEFTVSEVKGLVGKLNATNTNNTH